ncbi:DNA-binding protein [Dyadobacter sp. LJ419]|uniref:DNA-binding protein n=1 Tax=Dyadobacter chenwenxiniae TaxID=2906456 RepID=A0A9X1PJK2_9BACT|nr:DNA-binding protein [Dyadobacter chenwenxiniae]MCF0061339.1 DNA-binding protein [Dyadobacter chenwenxiniae]
MEVDEPDKQQLMSRKAAAEYLGTTAGVMAVWDCLKRYDFNPRKIAGMVYYHKDDLDRHLNRMFFA